jgi:hypothetical protein
MTRRGDVDRRAGPLIRELRRARAQAGLLPGAIATPGVPVLALRPYTGAWPSASIGPR